MEYRNLRNAWLVAGAVVCSLLVGLWLRTYEYSDTASKTTSDGVYLSIGMGYGTVVIIRSTNPSFLTSETGWVLKHRKLDGKSAMKLPWLPSREGDGQTTVTMIPFWTLVFCMSVCTSIFVMTWKRRRAFRFSLRALLIAAALVTVCLGSLVMMMRGD